MSRRRGEVRWLVAAVAESGVCAEWLGTVVNWHNFHRLSALQGQIVGRVSKSTHAVGYV